MNERLTALMTDAGFLDREGAIGRKRCARAVSDAASARGVDRTYSHTYVSRWLRGVVPRDVATREAIRDALAQQLGRPIEPDELGFRTADTTALDVGLAYPNQPEDGVAAVAQR